ncbi:Leucine-rich repeat domain, L domain-like protein [Heracleum sosnowskyi]|uniref:Leucine-rich repeat domain, L domain-like protein n=1 Tax=Heracleum sosnowskyi TaxID=360622 RepID=A0AAD8MNJ3_9APIA|nr:Leucine-rich repeat domain, L domain-like protein [Heracleum sosnowskyi]
MLGLKECFVEGQISRRLPPEEVNVLREIADQLRKKDWNFSVNPCDENHPNWNTPNIKSRPQYNNSVICSCSFPGGICHIEMIFLKGQDLDGIPPPSLAKLPYIKQIDLTRNYLHGTIPNEWASTKLELMSFIVNRLSGPIPGYIGNISTLKYLSLEHNMFRGSVPAELGKLVNLQNL